MTRIKIITTALLLATTANSAPAYALDSLEKVIMDGTPYIDARYRYEFADQSNLANDAHASTLRIRPGFVTQQYHGFSGRIEFDFIQEIGEDNYNNTLNRRTSRPVVADVENAEVNQLYIQSNHIPDTQIRIGREKIDIDDQRFIGSVDWRQNDQVYDAISMVNTSLPDTKITYAFFHNVNKIFGDHSPTGNWRSDSHIVNIANNSLPIGTLTAYAYLLDFQNDSPANSSNTYGASLVGAQKISEDLTFKYRAEYAHQQDAGDNTTHYDAHFYTLQPALQWRNLTTTLGYEVLGSDNGRIGFSTPLATLHKFNGWADVFLVTPTNGLRDAFVDLTYKFTNMATGYHFLDNLLVKAVYHDFQADHGSADFGTEWDFHVEKPITQHVNVHARYANYNTDSPANNAPGRDLERFIFGVGVKY